MKKIIYLIFITITLLHSQEIVYLDDVPEKFKKKYFSETHNYNPLQVGNFWQYSFPESIAERSVVKDTIANGQKYYKKLDYKYKRKNGQRKYFYHWERFDTSKQATYALDYNDEDFDENTNDELLLDSLEVPNYTSYISYRYTWKDDIIDEGPVETYILDSLWAIVFGDTVITRLVEYRDFFLTERVADKFGVITIVQESPTGILTGAIIDGKTYGTIVSVDREFKDENLEKDFVLFQNYPNPFNATTQITYQLESSSFVTLKVYNLLGQELLVLFSGRQYAGKHSVPFNAVNLPSGFYITNLVSNGKRTSIKALLLK